MRSTEIHHPNGRVQHLLCLSLGLTLSVLLLTLRKPNSMMVPIQSSMPHLDYESQEVAGSTCYEDIDMAHAYWQL